MWLERAIQCDNPTCIAPNCGSLKMFNFNSYVMIIGFSGILGDSKFGAFHVELSHCIALASYSWQTLVINSNNEVCSHSNNNVSKVFWNYQLLLGREILNQKVTKFSHSFHLLSRYKYLHDSGQIKISVCQGYYQKKGCLLNSLVLSWFYRPRSEASEGYVFTGVGHSLCSTRGCEQQLPPWAGPPPPPWTGATSPPPGGQGQRSTTSPSQVQRSTTPPPWTGPPLPPPGQEQHLRPPPPPRTGPPLPPPPRSGSKVNHLPPPSGHYAQAGSTHPTGMYSCFLIYLTQMLHLRLFFFLPHHIAPFLLSFSAPKSFKQN